MERKLPKETALLIIDVQNAIDDPKWYEWGKRNNPTAEEKMAVILKKWRQAGRRVLHVKHESKEPNSTYVGSQFKECVAPIDGEQIIAKNVHSAFIGTNLEEILTNLTITHLIVFGVITNNSVEATVRMAGNLGFTTYLVEDATFTFAKYDYNGQLRTAEEVHAMSLANLEHEYCEIIRTIRLIDMI